MVCEWEKRYGVSASRYSGRGEKPYEKVSNPRPPRHYYIGTLILYYIRLLDSSTLPPFPSPTVRIKIYARLGYM